MLKRLMAVLALLVLVAVGCGGGDDSSGGGDEEAEDRSDEPAEEEDEGVSEDEYAEAVSELCSDWFSETLEIEGSVTEIAGEVPDTTEDLVEELEGLEAPEDLDEAEDLPDAVSAFGETVAGIAENLEASEAQYGPDSSVRILGLGFEDEATMLAAREDLGEAFEAVDADCGFDEADPLAPLEEQSGDDSSDDFSDDFSDDPSSTTLPVDDAQDPESFITEYGTDPEFDALADSCFEGDYAACDDLYRMTPISESPNSYEGYGASCGGRRAEQGAGTCAETL